MPALLWPLLANLTRLTIAAVGGWLALRHDGDLSLVFFALSVVLTAFGLINAGAVAGGAWFGPIRWRWGRPIPAYSPRRADARALASRPGVEYARGP